MGRPREHDDETRDRLLGAAEELLSRGDALSVRAIAEATGTTTRAVYSVFGGMDGLYQALLARGFRVLGDRVAALPVTRDPAADLVRAGIEGFRAFAVEHPNLYRLAFERLVPDLSPTSEVGAVMVDALRVLGTRIQRCKDAGLIGDRPVREVVWQFHAYCQGLASVELAGWLAQSKLDPLSVWRHGLQAFVAGLTPLAPRRR